MRLSLDTMNWRRLLQVPLRRAMSLKVKVGEVMMRRRSSAGRSEIVGKDG